MNAHIKYQTIYEHGKPMFAVVPYREFLQFLPEASQEKEIPHEVVKKMVKEKISRIRAWREYLGLTQAEIALRMDITQAALSQMEKPKARLRKVTLAKLAQALRLHPDQLQ